MIYTKKLPLISGFSFIALVDTEEQAKALSNKYFLGLLDQQVVQ